MAQSFGGRIADHAIDPQFLERWSPRAFTGEAMPEPELEGRMAHYMSSSVRKGREREIKTCRAPERRHSFEHISWIEFEGVSLQEFQEFLLKRLSLMVCFLSSNVVEECIFG